MFSGLKKLKSSPPTIGLLCIFGIVLFVQILPPIFWPGGIGIKEDKSITTKTVETIEKDEQGKMVKTVLTTTRNNG